MKKQNKPITLWAIAILATAFTACQKPAKLNPSTSADGTKSNTLTTQSLTNGLIAYWPLDGNASDVSGNGHNGTTYNVTSVADRFGNANSAYHFNGSTSYISVADNAALRLNGTDFTINAWVKLDTYNSSFGSEVVDKRLPGGNTGYTFSINGYANTVSPLGTFGWGGGATSTVAIDTAQWHMITVVYTASSQEIKLYKDGVYNNTTSSMASPLSTNNATLYIGCDNPTISSPGYFFNGSMDDIRIYGKALDANTIGDIYGAPNVNTGLIAYWAFDGNANDFSGNNNNGTLHNVTPVADRNGNANSAYHFNGSNSFISVADNTALRLSGTDFTINAWVKLDDYNASYGSEVVDKRLPGGNTGYTFSINGYANTVSPLGTFGWGGTSTVALDTTQWHMVTAVYTVATQEVKLYKDGVYNNTTSSIASPLSTNNATLYIGCDNPIISSPGYFFNGAMDDIRIYNRALDATAITQLHNTIN
ncbi:LamG domain-containing protein [Mucilaginibacter paludis]|uniref:LamG domain protein jellyroll fold domain protein n=1 Tax=Mucilaginibacter paludis DSM 18603 TaxID=714943 RepID=H1Y003_9SPHI|nr:LamG domain-containing protein [Mucilaginibacter paludis]EHQ27845.1 LamG domain protein jellyroll fold domain protein [Mucilaginibacter paludis DSM 18603]